MAVKKRNKHGEHQKHVDLVALAKYFQFLNQQQNYYPQTPDAMKTCHDILRCLSRTTGSTEEVCKLLQPIEEFLLHLVANVKYHIRSQVIIAILDKLYTYICDHQAVISPLIVGVLAVFEGANQDTIHYAAKWIVKQRKVNKRGGTNHRVALSRLYEWLCDWHGTPALAKWILAYMKALEENQQFAILIEVSLNHLEKLFVAMGNFLRSRYDDVILHILKSMREIPEAFEKIAPHINIKLLNLASNSEQQSREVLQKLVDILLAMVDHLSKTGPTQRQEEFQKKYCLIIARLKLHISSGTSSFPPTWRTESEHDESLQASLSSRTQSAFQVGLVNLGNTCYMNSVLQALFAAKKFSIHVIMNSEVGEHWTKIGELFAKMMFGVAPAVSPIELYDTLKMSAFSGNQQHDSSEFLSHLFNMLRQQDNDNNNKARTESEPCHRGANNASGSKRKSTEPDIGPSRKRFRGPSQSPLRGTPGRSRNTFVEEMFGGTQLARVECGHCQHYTISRDVFCELHLSFPEKLMDKTHSVQSLLEFYCTTERMTGENQYKCPDCCVLRDAHRSVVIEQHPVHLVLVLKNFEYDAKNLVHTKLMHNVLCDLNIVMPAVRSQKQNSYNLFAAVIHTGVNIDSGHYYTVAKDEDGWHRYDDSNVTIFDEDLLNNLGFASTPYILFYRRSDAEDVILPTLNQLPQKVQDSIKTHNKMYETHR